MQTEISTALSRAMADAIPSTHSGSHKILVVGQLVVNVHSADGHSDSKRSKSTGSCCGKCHN